MYSRECGSCRQAGAAAAMARTLLSLAFLLLVCMQSCHGQKRMLQTLRKLQQVRDEDVVMQVHSDS
jgi:hypothetical protein